MQRSDDELNAVCLCPGRDHHINIALIQCSVCCILITTMRSLPPSLKSSNTQCTGMKVGRLLKVEWVKPVGNHTAITGVFMHYLIV